MDETCAGAAASLSQAPRRRCKARDEYQGPIGARQSRAVVACDSRRSWMPGSDRRPGMFTLAAAPAATGGTRVYAGGSTFLSSADRGATWKPLDAALDAHAAVFVFDDAVLPAGVYAISTGDELAGTGCRIAD